ncbi:hypothetical protein DVH24_032462 [Malus domestica]|uniref:Uncharacterized protein n=1 Tax=Malus domestica TaxID=3750 RepID=A0A498J5U6_MALDO|nr:hypothetical protein DVH24_032462 [Malus domestica]
MLRISTNQFPEAKETTSAMRNEIQELRTNARIFQLSQCTACVVFGSYICDEEQYLSGDVGRFLPNLVNFSVFLFLVFYAVQLSDFGEVVI